MTLSPIINGRMTMTKVACENVESWNLLSSTAKLGVCEEMLQFLHMAKKFIPLWCNIFVVRDMHTKVHIGHWIIFTDTAINFSFENTVFFFLFQLQWKRRGRRKVNIFPWLKRLWGRDCCEKCFFLSVLQLEWYTALWWHTAPRVLPSANFICSYCDNTVVVSTIGSSFLKQANTDQYQTLHHSGWEENERPLLPC